MHPQIRRLALRLAFLLAIFAAAAAVFWSLRDLRRPGGDTELMLGPWAKWLGDIRWIYHDRQPLAFLVHQALFRITRDAGLPIVDVYSLSAALAGGLMIALLAAAAPHPAVWVLVLANGTIWLFLGHAENYSLAHVATATALLLGWRHARQPEQTPLWPVVAAWCVALMFHRIAVFLAPAAAVLLLGREGGRWRRLRHGRGDLCLCLLMLTATALFYTLPHLLVVLHPRRWLLVVEIDNSWRDLITPLTQAQADRAAAQSQLGAWFHFTLFSPEHFRHMAHFHLTLAPAGLVSVIAFHRRWRGRPTLFLLVCSALMLVWSLVWHPHGSFSDWDLFTFMALPLNLTAGLLWAEWFRGRRRG